MKKDKPGYNNEKRSEIEKKILVEASRNRAFLKQLKDNPHKALHEKFGLEIPAHIKIVVHVEEPNSWHLVVSGVSMPSRLSEGEMENLAAGDCWV